MKYPIAFFILLPLFLVKMELLWCCKLPNYIMRQPGWCLCARRCFVLLCAVFICVVLSANKNPISIRHAGS